MNQRRSSLFLTLMVSVAMFPADQKSRPCFHGPNRNNLSTETGLMQAWPQVVTLSAPRILSFDPDNGHLLWDYPFANSRGNNVADVVVSKGLVYASSGYGKGSILRHPKPHPDGKFTVEPVWTSELLDNHHGGGLLVDGSLYGAGHEARGWFCLDFKTGAKRWQIRSKDSLTYADGHLYCLEERITMTLVKATLE